MTMKRILIAVLTVMIVISLAACSGGVSKEEAASACEKLFDALHEDDIAGAVALMHPDTNTGEDYFTGFIASVEEGCEVDFSDKIEIVRYTFASSSYYNSDVDGSRYETDVRIKVGDKELIATVEVVSNDHGYGIYNIHFDADVD